MYIPYIPHHLNATIGDRVVLLVVDCVFVIFFLCSCHCSPSCPSPMLLRVALVSWTVLIKCWTWIPRYFRALWSGIAETADWYLWAYGKTHRKPMEADSTWDSITMVNTIAGWCFGTWILWLSMYWERHNPNCCSPHHFSEGLKHVESVNVR